MPRQNCEVFIRTFINFQELEKFLKEKFIVKFQRNSPLINRISDELVVRSTGDQDVGVYECRASNPAGIATDYANVQFASEFENFFSNLFETLV